ncbi:MAG: hypothetical protein HQL41_05250 [Alphaproteobacteria bacterium]|nr:hypothetical protein [Alphaproteobacteria bacterium]
MSERRPPFRRCRVFLPFAPAQERHESMDYQNDGVLADLANWFVGPKLDWDWVPVLASTLAARVAEVAAGTVVVNLCDGDDRNGYPGISVVRALEAAGVPYTGADPAFYAVSTSKLAMKRRFAAAGVATAPWMALGDVEADLRRAAETIGFPLFVKPDVSAAAAGISSTSVVHDHAQAVARVRRVADGLHGFRFDPGSIFVERFLPGREFSVLVAADDGGAIAFAPCEKLFHWSLPPEQRFVTFARNYGGGEEPPPEDGGDAFRYGPVAAELAAPLRQTALDAFAALDATGYGRVDIRQDGDGRFVVLEVNANCGLSADKGLTTAGAILAFSGTTMRHMLDLMLWDAWRRWKGKPS